MGLFEFAWPVDQGGYEIRRTSGDPRSILTSAATVRVVGRGGAPRFYRPLTEHSGLWRQFAGGCVDEDSVLRFADRFGLLDGQGADDPRDFIESAAVIADIAERLDQKDADSRADAAGLFNEHARPWLTAGIRRNEEEKTRA